MKILGVIFNNMWGVCATALFVMLFILPDVLKPDVNTAGIIMTMMMLFQIQSYMKQRMDKMETEMKNHTNKNVLTAELRHLIENMYVPECYICKDKLRYVEKYGRWACVTCHDMAVFAELNDVIEPCAEGPGCPCCE